MNHISLYFVEVRGSDSASCGTVRAFARLLLIIILYVLKEYSDIEASLCYS